MPKDIVPESTSYDENKYSKVGFLEAVKIARWGFMILYKDEPLYTTLYLITRILNKFNDIVYTFLFAKILDVLINTIQKEGAAVSDTYPYVTILFIYAIINSLLYIISNKSRNHINVNSNLILQKNLYTKIHNLGIENMENPEMNNKIYRAQSTIYGIRGYVFDSINLLSNLINTISLLFMLISIIPEVTLILILVIIPQLYLDKKFRRKAYIHWFENTEKSRSAEFSASELTTPQGLQEVIPLGAFSFLENKFLNFKKLYNSVQIKINDQSNYFLSISSFFRDIVILFGYIKLFYKFFSRKFSIGDITFWMRTLNNLSGSMSSLSFEINDLSESAVRLKEIYLLFQLESKNNQGETKISNLTTGPNIEFKNISFSYPSNDRLIFNNFNLKINSGEKIAIVGKNGAGKTTLVRLIARFYRTYEGGIYINGINIKDLEQESFYNNISILLQDYNRYNHMTVRENIAIGMPNRKPDEEKIRFSAEAADCIDFINAYPKKFDTILSERFKGGIKPSTGQWQKIALARFFYREAPLVIFDEPTAAIDATSEAKIFSNIYKFLEGKTVIIISHRFSTVRNADRIIVLDAGKIVEEGSHEELIKLNGKYAEGFRLQAEGYKETIY